MQEYNNISLWTKLDNMGTCFRKLPTCYGLQNIIYEFAI